MFKIFTGNHLVEAYHRRKKEKRNSNTFSKVIKLLIAITMGIVLWALPTETFGIEGLTLIEQRVIALFCFATMMWVTEAIPLGQPLLPLSLSCSTLVQTVPCAGL